MVVLPSSSTQPPHDVKTMLYGRCEDVKTLKMPTAEAGYIMTRKFRKLLPYAENNFLFDGEFLIF